MDGRSVRWEAHNAAQRARIVDSAIALIESTGDLPPLLEVGQHAGVSRSVLYRQFADRSDLEMAVRARGMEMFWEAFAPVLTAPQGTVREVVHRASAAYVHWAEANRHLHQRADQSAGEASEVARSIDLIAAQIAELLINGFKAVGAEISEADVEATDPLVHGLVSGVYAAVRRWIVRGCKAPDAEHLIALLVEFAEALITSRLAAFGVRADFDAPVAVLLNSFEQ